MKLKECSVCKQYKVLWLSKPPTCKGCHSKTAKPKIVRRTEKKSNEITKSNEYYKDAIQRNIDKNGFCKCDNCDAPINHPSGRNVCHIIGFGADKRLYFDIANHFILCFKCADQEQNGDRTKMRIWPLFKEIRLQLLQTLIPQSRK